MNNMEKIKFGIHGCRHGHIEIFIKEMIELGHEFTGIYETEDKIAKKIANKYNVELFSDIDKLYATQPQIIGTSAINNKKIDIIELCEKRDIHVMTDKPVVTSRQSWERLEKVIKAKKIHVGMMLTERFNPPIFTLKKIIESGLLGNTVNIIFSKPHKLSQTKRPDWHFSKTQNGGIVIDLLVHDFDLLRWFTSDEVTEFKGYVINTESYSDESFSNSVTALVKTKSNITAGLYADWLIPEKHWAWGDGRIIYTGTRGRAEIRTNGDLLIDRKPYGSMFTEKRSHKIFKCINPPWSLSEDFLQRISGNENVIISSRDILQCSMCTLMADEALERIFLR